MSVDPSVVDVIVSAAQQAQVDPTLALAIAYQESGLDPLRVGDNGTSYGLFQLHQGGELTSAGLDPNGTGPGSWQDPYTNALVALTEVHNTQTRTGLTGGALAAAAQRPADAAGYAQAIDTMLAAAGPSPGPTAPGQPTPVGFNPLNPFDYWRHLPDLWGGKPIPKGSGPLGLPTPGDVGGALGGIGGDVAKGIAAGVKDIFAGASHTRAFQQSAQVIVGLVLLGLGVSLLKSELGPGKGWSSADLEDLRQEQTAEKDGPTQPPAGGMKGRRVDPNREPFPDDSELMKRQPATGRGAQTGRKGGAVKSVAGDAEEVAAA